MNTLDNVDFSDTHWVNVSKDVTIPEALNRIFTNSPQWIGILLKLRNKIVSLLGLNTDGVEKFDARKLKDGDKIGFLHVLKINDSLALIRGNDKHLDFIVKISLSHSSKNTSKDEQILSCQTDVQFHNVWGRSYFFFVAPFHKLIVPVMLKSAVKD